MWPWKKKVEPIEMQDLVRRPVPEMTVKPVRNYTMADCKQMGMRYRDLNTGKFVAWKMLH